MELWLEENLVVLMSIGLALLVTGLILPKATGTLLGDQPPWVIPLALAMFAWHGTVTAILALVLFVDVPDAWFLVYVLSILLLCMMCIASGVFLYNAITDLPRYAIRVGFHYVAGTTTFVIFAFGAAYIWLDGGHRNWIVALAIGLVTYWGFLVYHYVTYDEEIEEVSVTDRYMQWIDNHEPSLPPLAKEEYMRAAQLIVRIYETERLAETTDALVLSRRRLDTIIPLGELQHLMYQQYTELAAALNPPESDLPPLPLPGEQDGLRTALATLATKTYPYRPWDFTPKLLTEERDILARSNPFLATSPFARTALLLLGHERPEEAF